MRARKVSTRRYVGAMGRPSSHPQSWTDDQLAEAIKASTNWVSVMRELGFGERSSSAGAIRIVRRRVVELGLDASHFQGKGKRRWSDGQLRQAVTESSTWGEVLTRLGLSSNSGAPPHIKANAIRLGLDTSHLNQLSHLGRPPTEAPAEISDLKADLKHLRVAAPAVAAAWFTFRGCAVSVPAEPTVYDLLVDAPGGISRVQVKTTTFFMKYGWAVSVSHHPDTHAKKRGHRVAYDPDVIDLFFIIDGDLTMYLIPSRAIAGRLQVLLRTYKKYIVGSAAGLLCASAAAVLPTVATSEVVVRTKVAPTDAARASA
jgi:hypothetical protein